LPRPTLLLKLRSKDGAKHLEENEGVRKASRPGPRKGKRAEKKARASRRLLVARPASRTRTMIRAALLAPLLLATTVLAQQRMCPISDVSAWLLR